MGIFDRFPYSSTHEMNLDFMLGKATEIAEDMQTVATGMAQVQSGLSAISEKTEQATQAAAAAAQSASSIEGSVTAAEEAAEEAQMHNESAQTWANNAMTYKADCQRSATEAAASSSSAAQAATAAAASEDTVATYAQAANASAQSAANNNDSAHQYANQASASASNATFHSSNAQTAATNAQTAATNANTSATNAAASADRAASLKTDVETLHRMCVTAVDQATEQAVAAGNSAGQAAATKTEVENLVESLPEDFTDLNNTVNQLSDEIDGVKSDLNNMTGTTICDFSSGYINTSTSPINSDNVVSSTITYHAIIPCVEGDAFTIRGYTASGAAARVFVFINASGSRLTPFAQSGVEYDNYTVIAPANSAYIIVQSLLSFNPYCYKGELVKNRITKIENSLPDIFFEGAFTWTKRVFGLRMLADAQGCYFIPFNALGQGVSRGNGTDGNDYYIDNIHPTQLGAYNLGLGVWSYLKHIPCWYESVPGTVTQPLDGTQWSGKSWYAYGTSLTAGTTSTNRYADFVANMSGLVLTNKGIGGGALVNNRNIYNALLDTTDGKLDADLITIEVGANDSGSLGNPWSLDTSEFYGALNHCIREMFAAGVRAQIVIMASYPSRYAEGDSSNKYDVNRLLNT